ncbi:MAG TPA: saccharopine dehydrogenase, partial [Micromonosporaceae bacterium]|nr:saccharopine dehydrogenase [Micromonosporaceae bacterium]
GPSRSIGDTVARAALAAGAAYVDAGGDEPLRRGLAGSGRPVVLAAGLSPGLSGLLPRWLAAKLPEPARRLRAWCGGLERFTPAAAADMVASLGDGSGGSDGSDGSGGGGESMAAWRAGAPAGHALKAIHDAVVPPFPGRVSAYPYLSHETRRLAAELGLAEVDWYHVIAGRHTLATLNELRTTGERSAHDCLRAGARLVAAAELDLAGLRPYQVIVLELQGTSLSQTLMLRAADGYRLTAAVTAAAVDAVLSGTVPAGAHLAADVLDPDDVVARLTTTNAVTMLQVTAGTAVAAIEEGVL